MWDFDRNMRMGARRSAEFQKISTRFATARKTRRAAV
jgi:hypothetical protein